MSTNVCRRKICVNDKKTLCFHFSSERIKLQTFALSMQWKSPETTLESRIDSFLSNLRSSVLGVAWKSEDGGRAEKQRLSVNRERSWLSHIDEQSIMPINLFNLFDSFWTDPWSLILDPWSLILDPWSLISDPWFSDSVILDPVFPGNRKQVSPQRSYAIGV